MLAIYISTFTERNTSTEKSTFKSHPRHHCMLSPAPKEIREGAHLIQAIQQFSGRTNVRQKAAKPVINPKTAILKQWHSPFQT